MTPNNTGPGNMGMVTPESMGKASSSFTGSTTPIYIGDSTGNVMCNVGNIVMGVGRGILRPSRYSVKGNTRLPNMCKSKYAKSVMKDLIPLRISWSEQKEVRYFNKSIVRIAH